MIRQLVQQTIGDEVVGLCPDERPQRLEGPPSVPVRIAGIRGEERLEVEVGALRDRPLFGRGAGPQDSKGLVDRDPGIHAVGRRRIPEAEGREDGREEQDDDRRDSGDLSVGGRVDAHRRPHGSGEVHALQESYASMPRPSGKCEAGRGGSAAPHAGGNPQARTRAEAVDSAGGYRSGMGLSGVSAGGRGPRGRSLASRRGRLRGGRSRR